MSEILLQYKRPDPTTWVYLSSFLTIGLYFVFHRFWSLRNVDIILLILLAPGLLMVHEGRRRRLVELEAATAVVQDQDHGRESTNRPTENIENQLDQSRNESMQPAGPSNGVVATIDTNELMTSVQVERFGFVWLLGVQVLILFRLIVDPLMVRRPLLDPNLTTGGMLFLGAWLFIFMMANVVTSTPRLQIEQGPQLGPGYSLMNMLPAIPTRPTQEAILGVDATDAVEPARVYVILARVLAIAAHLGIVTGIIGIGFRHFNNPRAGVGCAMLYLLMPYTAQTTGRVDHALPAALLVWAVLSYRRPFIAGLFLGAAAGLVYYPLVFVAAVAEFLLATRRGTIRRRRGNGANHHDGVFGRRWQRTAWKTFDADVWIDDAADERPSRDLGLGLGTDVPIADLGRLHDPQRFLGSMASTEKPRDT
jgi:hypothetical protein